MTELTFISIFSFFLFFLRPPSSSAQLTSGDEPFSTLAVEPISSTPAVAPPSTSLLPGFQQSTAPADPTRTGDVPVFTSNGDPTDQPDTNSGIVNYYFLLLAIFIFIIIILYLSWTRNRKKRLEQFQHNREYALHRDLDRWDRWGAHGRWMYHGNRRGFMREPRREEGLDERGEAPPPYMPDRPPPVVVRDDSIHQDQRQNVPLQDLSPDQRKPPDYTIRSTTSP